MSIGWYIHHHGSGHLARFLAVRAHFAEAVVCFSSLPEPAGLPVNTRWVQLERDDELAGHAEHQHRASADGLLHWAPLHHPPHTARLARIAQEVVTAGIRVMVVDVSAEVTLFARVLGLQPVVFTQPGDRDDAPHRLAFSAAARIIAPWPRRLLQPAHLGEWTEKTVYTGGISRFDGRTRSSVGRATEAPGSVQPIVTVLNGRGGAAVTAADVRNAAEAAPDHAWQAIGFSSGAATASPTFTDPWNALTEAATVVSWAGLGSIADIAAAGARAVLIPQERPFREQVATADALDRAGLAVVVPTWPRAHEWPEVLRRADALRPDWSRWQVAGAAARAADTIASVGERSPVPVA